jgi:hypothetical protein
LLGKNLPLLNSRPLQPTDNLLLSNKRRLLLDKNLPLSGNNLLLPSSKRLPPNRNRPAASFLLILFLQRYVEVPALLRQGG